jgi:hypothetical protein
LAALTGADDPARAIETHRRILDRAPDSWDSYRALRELFLAAGDTDGAFCAEAVLEGLGLADEEEAYFYRQRRAGLPAPTGAVLTEDERRLVCPRADDPAVVLLGAIDTALADVFPVDVDGYGIAGDRPAIAPELQQAVERAGELFGVGALAAAMVPARLGPTVEPGRPPLLLLPRGLDEVSRREQLYAIGALAGRIAFHGAITDPRRILPTRPQLLEYLLTAAIDIALPARAGSITGKPVFDDIKRRLAAALSANAVEPIRAAAEACTAPDGDALQKLFDATSLRAGLVACQDPAIAAAAMRGPSGALPPTDALRILSFTVSAGFLALRRRARLGVAS